MYISMYIDICSILFPNNSFFLTPLGKFVGVLFLLSLIFPFSISILSTVDITVNNYVNVKPELTVHVCL